MHDCIFSLYTFYLLLFIEQVLAATLHKAPTIRPPASHHENCQSSTNQTCRAQLEKQGRTHQWCTPMDPRIWLSKSRTTSSNIHTYSSSVRIRDVALKTCQRRWMIGRSGERGSGISVLAAWHDDDDFDKNPLLCEQFPWYQSPDEGH